MTMTAEIYLLFFFFLIWNSMNEELAGLNSPVDCLLDFKEVFCILTFPNHV